MLDMFQSKVVASALLLCLVIQCTASCNRQGYQCEGDQSLNCRCWNERTCYRRSMDEDANEGAAEGEAAAGGEEATMRIFKSNHNSYNSNSGSHSSNCRNRERCSENFRETCDNGCNQANGACKSDTEACGDTWDATFASGFCGSDNNLPSDYISWKNHMTKNDRGCANVNGESCLQLGARNDAAWFAQNVKVFPVSKIACDPSPADNTSVWCMNGTIPASLASVSGFFSASNTQTQYTVSDSSLMESGQAASVTIDPSACVAAWSTFSCQRNIPECKDDNAESEPCYDVCEQVSLCLDAFLLHCVNLSSTPAGAGDCEGFDWNTTTEGGRCNPGFECQGLQGDSTLTATELRNCRNGVEKCQDRPYMLDGGYCQRGDDLPNLCDQFQQYPTTAAVALLRINTGLVVFLAALAATHAIA